MVTKGPAGKNRIPVAISGCLLGEKSRYDLSDKSIPSITDALADHFTWVPFCPEMEIGLGAPREKLNLTVTGAEVRLTGDESGIDYTRKMERHAMARVKDLSHVCGYILKSKSPSCGLSGDTGIFSRIVLTRFPGIPMVDEGGLDNDEGRKSFVEKVFIYHRERRLSNA
ncbi:hypothetical protein MNBD_NITROSPINAE02-1049 [hydrothermal vent metagenome]|uniref:Uncharacterized protein n=1 Tax=hydrothermal vent metagenome TaxID=652676 RepID=A0A3B1C359_9ZZZZ